MTEDKIVAIREIKLTLKFVIAEPFFDPNFDYNTQINHWVARVVLSQLNSKYPSSELAPVMAYVKAEDITS